jgi:DNA polymerase-3 subunit alpha
MFVHLKTKTIYSLLEGAIFAKALANRCCEFKMPAVGIADRANLFGALEFSEVLSDNGIQPIIGCQLPISAKETDLKKLKVTDQISMLFLAKNETGYRNLMELSSKFFLNDVYRFEGMSIKEINKFSDGLICLSGGDESPINSLLRDNKIKEAENLLLGFKKTFGDRFYLEMNRHPLGENFCKKIITEDNILDLADKHNLPLVATNDVYFLEKELHQPHDALLCISEGSYVDQQQERRSLSVDHYFKSENEMKDLFDDIPEAIENTVEIAMRCSFRPTSRDAMLPRFSPNADADLEQETKKGLDLRLKQLSGVGDEKVYLDRVSYELEVIKNMGFSGYFLIVADIVKWAKAEGIPVGPGRGSGAGSLVAFSLTITDLDPIKYSLLFERFLNPSRISMPDFDIDFCMDRRNEIIDYVKQKYGKENVAQIITFGALWSKAAIRDIGRVLQLPYSRVDKIAKLIPVQGTKPISLNEAMETEEALIEEARSDEQVSRMLNISRELEGVLRNASTHAAGIVIGDRKLVELVPLYQDPRSDMPATQFTKDWVERAGLVKFDFLGLKTLTIINEAVSLVNLSSSIDLDINKIPLNDIETFKLYSEAKTMSVFQVESKGMRDALIDLKPNTLEDIIALVALYRPGPMENIPAFCEAKNDPKKRQFLHPSIDKILDETHGIIVYQEQVMEIAQKMAGYSLGDADLLRKAMGKKIKEVMDAEKPKFLEGADKNGIENKTAEGIWDLLAKFANYGFNKSHAAAYAVLSYQTAYLKTHHPAEFITASMNNDINNMEKFSNYFDDINAFGLTMCPPCINRSEVKFSVIKDRILFGLGAIKNVGIESMSKIVENRKMNGKFIDIYDFAKRVPLKKIGKRPLEMLISSGAFAEFNFENTALLERLEELILYSSACHEEEGSRQVNLFSNSIETIKKPEFKTTNSSSRSMKSKEIYDVTGIYFISPYNYEPAFYESLGIKEFSTLSKSLADFQSIMTAGFITDLSLKTTKDGRQYFLVSLIDHRVKTFDVFIFPDRLTALTADLLVGEFVLLVIEKTKDKNGHGRINVKSVRNLEKFIGDRKRKQYHFVIGTNCKVSRISSLLKGAVMKQTSDGGNVLITVKDEESQEKTNISLPYFYDISSEVIENIKAIEGVFEIQAE